MINLPLIASVPNCRCVGGIIVGVFARVAVASIW
jgi:hypothetical protein